MFVLRSGLRFSFWALEAWTESEEKTILVSENGLFLTLGLGTSSVPYRSESKKMSQIELCNWNFLFRSRGHQFWGRGLQERFIGRRFQAFQRSACWQLGALTLSPSRKRLFIANCLSMGTTMSIVPPAAINPPENFLDKYRKAGKASCLFSTRYKSSSKSRRYLRVDVNWIEEVWLVNWFSKYMNYIFVTVWHLVHVVD